jgi:hypothetical protein
VRQRTNLAPVTPIRLRNSVLAMVITALVGALFGQWFKSQLLEERQKTLGLDGLT